jgi:recombination protein RecR
MLHYAEPIRELIEQLERLPGIGPKSGQRLAFFLLAAGPERAEQLAQAIIEVHQRIRRCTECGSFSVDEHCPICLDQSRDRSMVCVVADAKDLMALERAGEYRGLYHVLGGVLSPMDDVGPDELHIDELLRRVEESGFAEVILATPPTVEGDATAEYIRSLLAGRSGLRVTRPALGLPVGADLDYADQVTVARALRGRTDMTD